MTIIDQRILIPAESRRVWEHISNLENNPGWQTDCRSVSFLTSMHTGPGVRWRYTNASGRDYVVEISAWYDGLGYEYTLVDGASFRENRGRIRLQEIPEGTVVQWTFTYETGGMLGGLRNSLSTRKQIESTIIDSLRKLWRVISEAGASHSLQEAKSLMRDAPDAQARAQYRPRHPSALQEETQRAAHQPAPGIQEPPVSDEDTRPRPAVAAIAEPDFLAEIKPLDSAPTETVPHAPETLPEFAHGSTTEVLPTPAMEGRAEPAAAAVETSPALREEIAEEDELRELPTPGESRMQKEPSKIDTGQISVFEVFGLPKPSETQQLQSVAPPTETSKPPTPVIMEPVRLAEDTQPTGATGRFMAIQRRPGLRQALRHESVNIRRP